MGSDLQNLSFYLPLLQKVLRNSLAPNQIFNAILHLLFSVAA